ncbi:MAG: HTTM domain-containing protein [Planctomycetota bacterium]|nr:HTTM domain-containing protein [Planctomycetota bacterium]
MKSLSAAYPAPGSISALFRIDIRTLALFRVLISTLVLVDLIIRSGDLQTMYADQGVIPIHLVTNHFQATWRWSLFWINGSIYFQAAMFALTAMFALSLLVGFYTRIATIGSWILLTSLYNRIPFAVSGADTLLVILYFWAMFLPLGRCWSVDAWQSKQTGKETEKTVLTGATFAILIQVFLLYFCTGCYKAIYHAEPGMLLQNTLEWGDYNRPLGNWLVGFPRLLGVLSLCAITFELLAPWLLLSPWKTSKVRLWTLSGLIALHLGIELTISVALFSYVAAASFCLFLPSSFWDADFWKPVRSFFYPSKKTDTRRFQSVPKIKSPIYLFLFNVACIVLIINVVVLSVFGFFQRGELYTKPNFLNRVNELTMLNQRWSMFATMQLTQTRMIAHARLNNGQELDLLRVEPQSAGSLSPVQHPNHRWIKYFQALSKKSTPKVFKYHYARWLFENWNRSHSDSEQIQVLSLRRLRQRLVDEQNLTYKGTETLAVIRNDQLPIEDTIQWGSPWRNP